MAHPAPELLHHQLRSSDPTRGIMQVEPPPDLLRNEGALRPPCRKRHLDIRSVTRAFCKVGYRLGPRTTLAASAQHPPPQKSFARRTSDRSVLYLGVRSAPYMAQTEWFLSRSVPWCLGALAPQRHSATAPQRPTNRTIQGNAPWHCQYEKAPGACNTRGLGRSCPT